MGQSIEGLYPFLLLIGVSIFKGLYKRAKEKKEQEKKIIRPAPRPPQYQSKVELPPSVSIEKIEPVKLSKVAEKQIFHRKKKPRIGKLVSRLKNKKDLVLLSEILINKHNLH
ncbi:MAG: hypothetical protein QNJ27_00185 [Simkaniaceae bacterium]|nr:hypothetical protein [Simkaniaceae bacterium]